MLKLNHTLGIRSDMWRQADSLPDGTEHMSELLGTVHGRASTSNRNLRRDRFDLGATLLFSKLYQSDGMGVDRPLDHFLGMVIAEPKSRTAHHRKRLEHEPYGTRHVLQGQCLIRLRPQIAEYSNGV